MAAEECLLKILPQEVPLRYVEIGVLRATNLVALAKFFPLMQITGVDSYQPYTDPAHGGYVVDKALSEMNKEIALNAIKNSPHKDRINLVIEDSKKYASTVPNESFDVVFLDKGFDTEVQSLDIQDWYSKVKSGGIFCGHDAGTPDIWAGVLKGLKKVGIETIPAIIDAEVWYITKV